MKNINIKNNRGFIALISTIVISSVLVILTLAVSQAGFFSRDNSVKSEYKKISKGMAESCVNEALLKIAENPNININESGNDYKFESENIDVPCNYSIEKTYPEGSRYDSSHKKILKIVAWAKYNDAFSKVEISSNVYDPEFTPPSRLIVKVYTYTNGDNSTPFGDIKVMIDGIEKDINTALILGAGNYEITENLNSDYTTSYTGDCEDTGGEGQVTLGINDYKTCNIINTLKPQTAKLNIVIAGNGPKPNSLIFNGNSLTPLSSQEIIINKSELKTSGSKDFSINIEGIDFDKYVVSNWAGNNCSGLYNSGIVSLAKGDNKACVITVNEKPIPTQAALGIVTRIFNPNGGIKKATDFPTPIISGVSNTIQNTVISSNEEIINRTYYVDPGTFNVEQGDLSNYTKIYQNIDLSHLCHGTAVAGQSYLCVIDYTDIPTTFSLTGIVNITRAYGIAPVPNFSINLSGPGGNKTMTSGTALSGLSSGNYIVSLSGIPSIYSVSQWGEDCDTDGNVSWSPTEKRNKVCKINIVENPPPFRDIDTVLMLDRTGSMFDNSNWIGGERTAAKAFLDSFDALSEPKPQVGIGVFANDSGSSAQIMPTGTLTSDYGSNEIMVTTSTGSNLPGKSGTNSIWGSGGKNDWTNPDNGRNIDTSFATDSTNGHQQDYSNFNFNIPSNATITGIEVIADGKVAVNTQSATTYPNNVGNYNPNNTWGTDSNSYSNTNKINAVKDSSDSTYITSSTTTSGIAQTFKIDTSSIPAGSIINSVILSARARKSSNNSSPTLALRIEKGVNQNDRFDYSLGNLTTSFTSYNTSVLDKNPINNSAWGSVENLSQLGFGVVKTNNVNSAIRVSQIFITINYTPIASGQVAVSLSSNNGSSWTAAKNVNLTTTEASYTPIGNNPTDLWGRTWASSDFINGSAWNSTGFALRLQNNSTSGTAVSVNYVTVKVYYTALMATKLYLAINNGLANSEGGTDLSAAISVGNEELNSARHISGHKKYLIMLSDGEPTYPGNGRDITQGAIDAALSSATTAKNSGTEIYTIHFGNNSVLPSPYNNKTSRNLIAMLATNSDYDPTKTIDYENGDKDHFFIVPVTANPTTAMVDIFNKIGQQIIEAETPPTATTGTLNVITHVINNDPSHTKISSDFSFTLNSTSYTGKENPGKTFTLNSGSFNVTSSDDSNYIKTMSSECSGEMLAGEEKTCIITYDDTTPTNSIPIPSLPPPPPSVEIKPTLVVVTLVNNSSGTAGKSSSDFEINSINPLKTFNGSETGELLNPTPGNYEILAEKDSSYSNPIMSSCVGSISGGESKVCIITYIANPPEDPTIDIKQNIDINSWQEVP